MNRFYSLTSVFLVATGFSLLLSSAHAQEVYKWTDANGKVHYGDRSAAPEGSRKMNIAAAPPSPPPAVPASVATSQRRPPLPPHRDSSKKSVPANPALVGSACKGLVDKIAAVPAGTNWESLSRQFNSGCPGIAYECVEYRSSPQNNQCMWIERTGSNILNRNMYP